MNDLTVNNIQNNCFKEISHNVWLWVTLLINIFSKQLFPRDFTDFEKVKDFEKWKIIKSFMSRDFTDFRIVNDNNDKHLLEQLFLKEMIEF
jgi:hypothetical protein